MSKLSWYWHRLRAMQPVEIAAHFRKKLYQWQDARRLPGWPDAKLEPATDAFPKLPRSEDAPTVLREALARDAKDILAGRWKAFGHLEIQVDDPPLWHKDYLVGKNLATNESAFKLNHRELPAGADIKLIWELSRWYQLVRLAQAAYVLGDAVAAQTCKRWLTDWVAGNPPYRGWNWTSALEAGMRLIQFTWIDALLEGAGVRTALSAQAGIDANTRTNRGAFRSAILPPHVWFTWRHRSFGSSANNHLLGELAGLILAIARWPELARWAAPLVDLKKLWEKEVLSQFAPDGGNREQALNYHLFSWEFCWQARAALQAANLTVSAEVEERLGRAVDFFTTVQVANEPWDYGDSDNADVTPFFAGETTATNEWLTWFNAPQSSPAIRYWWGDAPAPAANPACVSGARDWLIYPHSGIAVCWSGDWNLRWDLSPLGYLSTAAHGHLDALHLSLWYKEMALVIDPGTGAYYGDTRLRAHLASWTAHNGPRPVELDSPKRLGSFLWSEAHANPFIKRKSDMDITAELASPEGRIERTVTRLDEKDGWQVDDDYEPNDFSGVGSFSVSWQFAPGWELERLGERIFRVNKSGISITIGLDAAWAKVEPFSPSNAQANHPFTGDFRGVCSPAFRKVCFGPALLLTARGHNPCLFRTTFLASRDS